MRKSIYSALFLLTLSTRVSAELFFQESFSYNVGDLAAVDDTGAPLNSNSFSNSPWENVNDPETTSVVSPSLEPSSIPFLDILGGRAVQTNGISRIANDLMSITEISGVQDGETLYISFIQKYENGATDVSRIVEFWNGEPVGTSTVFSFGTDTNAAAPDFGILVEKGDPNAEGIETSDFTLTDEPVLVVIRVDYGSNGEPDTLRYYLNPGISEPAMANGEFLNTVNNFDLTFNRIGFGSFQQSAMEADEFRIASTYAEVVPIGNDRDGDQIPDSYEIANGLDPDDGGDASLDNDADGGPDGLTNLQEFLIGTNPQLADTDGDSLLDGDEVNGTLNPYREDHVAGQQPAGAPGAATSPILPDSDNDGISDAEEIATGDDGFITNPNSNDTDGDELLDLFESTDRGNGTLDPTSAEGGNGPDDDPDMDDLFNIDEVDAGTDPRNPDTDNDGYLDGAEDGLGEFFDENETGTDPLDEDSDNDGLLDGQENPVDGRPNPNFPGLTYFTDPNIADTDGDLFIDGVEVMFGSDPNDINSTPSIDPVPVAVQVDFADLASSVDNGIYAPADGEAIITPAHVSGVLGAEDRFFNAVDSGDAEGSTIFSSRGVFLPTVRVEVGISSVDGNDVETFDYTAAVGTSMDNPLITGDSIFDNTLWSDRLFTRNNDNLATRISGLAAGSYDVIAFCFQFENPERTYNARFGTQSLSGAEAPVFGPESIGFAGDDPAEVPGELILNRSHFTQRVELEDDQAIVIVIDPTNSEFSNFEGFQIIPVVSVIDITNAAFTDESTYVIDFQGSGETSYGLFEASDLMFSDTPIQTLNTDANGVGQFSVTVDRTTTPQQFFRVQEIETN